MKNTISKYNILFAVTSFIMTAVCISQFIMDLTRYRYDNFMKIFLFNNVAPLSSSFIFLTIGICCLLGANQTIKKTIFSIFSFVSSALFLIKIIITPYITVNSVLYAVVFAVLGILVLVDKKKTASCIFTISAMTTDIIFTFISIFLHNLQSKSSSYDETRNLLEIISRLGFNYDLSSIIYGIIPTMLGVLVYFIITGIEIERKIKAESNSEISLNSDIIDFKTLLSYIENQYKTGEIGEEDYKKKRAEILKKL